MSIATELVSLGKFIIHCGTRIDENRIEYLADVSLDIGDFIAQKHPDMRVKETVIALYGLLKIIEDGTYGRS